MNAEPQKGWWYRATRDQKLAQIDAGIELGMTANQIAMNCGCYNDQNYTHSQGATVYAYAARHGRQFPANPTSNTADKGWVFVDGKPTHRRTVRIDKAKASYFAGEPINIWAVK